VYPVLYPGYLGSGGTLRLTSRPSRISNGRVRDDAANAGAGPQGRRTGLILKVNQVASPRKFLISAGLLLIVTGGAKLLSILGKGHILDLPDPVFGITFRALFLGAGLLEFVIGLECLRPGNAVWRAGLVAWLASSFVVYRLGLIWVGYHGACPCAGTLTGALHISPHAADTIMKIVLLYLLVGSYGCLLLSRWKAARGRGALGPATGAAA
jgi:hypothetical protein